MWEGFVLRVPAAWLSGRRRHQQRGGWEPRRAWLGQCSYLDEAVTVGACFTIIIFLSRLYTQGGAGTLDFEIQSQMLPRLGQPHGCLSLPTCQSAQNVERRGTLTQTVGSGGRRVSAGSSAAAAAPSGGMLMGGGSAEAGGVYGKSRYFPLMCWEPNAALRNGIR